MKPYFQTKILPNLQVQKMQTNPHLKVQFTNCGNFIHFQVVVCLQFNHEFKQFSVLYGAMIFLHYLLAFS